MNREHFEHLKTMLPKDKFIVKSLNDVDKQNQHKAIGFIQSLIDNGISLDKINTNDWNSSPYVRVYVEKSVALNDFRVYKRFSNHDIKNAIRFMEAK